MRRCTDSTQTSLPSCILDQGLQSLWSPPHPRPAFCGRKNPTTHSKLQSRSTYWCRSTETPLCAQSSSAAFGCHGRTGCRTQTTSPIRPARRDCHRRSSECTEIFPSQRFGIPLTWPSTGLRKIGFESVLWPQTASRGTAGPATA